MNIDNCGGICRNYQLKLLVKRLNFMLCIFVALHDPELTRSLAVDCVMVRKSVKPAPISANVQPFALEICIEGKRSPDRAVNHALLLSPLLETINPDSKGALERIFSILALVDHENHHLRKVLYAKLSALLAFIDLLPLIVGGGPFFSVHKSSFIAL
ncbi:MAG: hypothetical protein KME31_19195 [Tolypothrix carrinoi HA7290-LM1]|nr:hypothetical protein [Tolypothrix carrinoi HA7290-LM1]